MKLYKLVQFYRITLISALLVGFFLDEMTIVK